MLIRISGGTAGIKEYLEKGRKEGRELSRDELDERVILAGDLETTNEIILSMDGNAEKYLHITIAFKEDEIDRVTLDAVVREFKEFAFSAYEPDEYSFYAEAHLPKVKSYTHAKTGEFIERKGHIHIVIPEKNLLSNQRLNPFGMVEQNERFIDALQESINNKFGLASPKDNRRIEFTGASEMISRHKGDIFDGQNKALKGDILETMLSKNIERYDDFKAMLAQHGETKPRHAGKNTEYQNVKTPGGTAVNLKEYVFSREFVELPTDQKRERLAAELQRKYEVASAARRDPAHITKQLNEWHQTRAKEIKYLNSGDRKTYQAYRQASPDERQQQLAERESRFYTKHRKDPSNEQENRSGTDRAAGADRFGRGYGFKQPAGTERTAGPDRAAGNRQFDPKPFGQGTPPQSLNSVRTLSSVSVVSFAKGSEVLLPDHARNQLEHHRTEPADGLRRPTDRAASLKPTGREADSALFQRSRDLREDKQADRAGRQADMQEVKQKLDAGRLLAELSRSHGVIPEKYEVTKAKDGSDRIKCGTRNLNVSDFLTKELNMPWRDAEKTLRDSYTRQAGREVKQEPRQEPRRQLWAEFQAERKGQVQLQRTTQLDAQRTSERERREAIKKEFYAKRSKAQGNRGASAAERKAAVSVARMERLLKEAALRDRIKTERDQLKVRKPATEQYRDFLTDKAQAGDERALAELRRMSPAPTEKARDTDAQVTAAEPTKDKQDREPIHSAPAITYQVHRNGDVTYQRAGRDMLRDQGKAVHMLQNDSQTIETGLRLAQQKFGSKLALSGPQDFQEKAARVAAEAGLKVEFTDQRLNKIMRDRSAELEVRKAADIEAGKRGEAFGKEREQAVAGKGKAKTPEQRQGPQKGQEGPAPAGVVPADSKLPYKDGQTTGPIVAVDQNHVYQRHGRDNIRHDRKDFNEALKPGDIVQVQYHQGRATVKNQVQEQAKRQNLDDGKGQEGPGL
jgi:hypothetical protein